MIKKHIFHAIVFIILLGVSINIAQSKYTESETKCDLFDCYTVLKSDTDLAPAYLSKSYTTNELPNTQLNLKSGSVTNMKVEFLDKNTIKISGKIQGATNNYWGMKILNDSSFWSSTWWNSSYPFRYEIYSKNTNEKVISVNDTVGLCGSVYWLHEKNDSYIYCKVYGCCGGDITFANATDRKYWENETTRAGYLPTLAYDKDTIAIYHFGEGSGTTAYDSSQYGHNSASWGNTPEYVAGKFKTALDFESAENDYINITDTNALDLNISDRISICAWLKYESFDNNSKVINKGWTSSVEPYITYSLGGDAQGDNVEFQLACLGTRKTLDSNTKLALGSWFHVCGTWDNVTMRIYINGVQDSNTQSATGKISQTNMPLTIGAWIVTGTPLSKMDGLMDDVRIYNKTLSLQEIEAMYWNGINNLTSFSSAQNVSVPHWADWSTPAPPTEIWDTNISWTDSDLGMDKALLENNFTGSMVNGTMSNATYGGAIYNYTSTITSGQGNYCVRSYANNTGNYWNSTMQLCFLYTTTSTSSTTTPVTTVSNATTINFGNVSEIITYQCSNDKHYLIKNSTTFNGSDYINQYNSTFCEYNCTETLFGTKCNYSSWLNWGLTVLIIIILAGAIYLIVFFIRKVWGG